MQRSYLSLVFHLNDSPSVSTEDYRRYVENFCREVVYLLEKTPCKQLSISLCGRALEGLARIPAKLLSEIRHYTKENQIEWLGGGFYDPLFPLLPESAQKLQIEEHSDLLKNTLETSPRGIWLPSFVWEDSLIQLFSQFGFEYTILKDYQIQQHLWKYPTYKGYFTVEDRGDVLKVLPSASRLFQQFRDREFGALCDSLFPTLPQAQRYFTLDVPFMRHSRGHYEGFWFEFVKHLLVEVERRDKVLGFRTISNQMDEQRCGGAINLGSSIGKSLGLAPQLKSCRDFLIFHPECNFLHKKTLYLLRQIEALEDKETSKELSKELLPVQSVFYYRTHAETGGVHLLEDRSRSMSILLGVEEKLRKHQNAKGIRVEVKDFLSNGSKQIYCQNRHLSFLLEHDVGGRLRSLEFRSLGLNLINGFKQPSPLQSDHYDISPICGMEERIITDKVWIDEYSEGLLSDPYAYHLKTAKDKQQILLSGEQDFKIEGKQHRFQVEKALTLKGMAQEIQFNHQFTNATFHKCEAFVAVSLPISFKNFDVPKQYFKVENGEKQSLATRDTFENVHWIEFRDKSLGLELKWEFLKEVSLQVGPVYDRHNGDFQCFQVVAIIPFSILGQEKFSFSSTIKMSKRRLIR